MAGDKQFPSFLASSFYLCLTLILKSDHSLERQSVCTAHCAGALAGLGPPVAMVSMAAPVFSGISSSALVRITSAGVCQMKMAPSEPAVTMNFWSGEMAIYKTGQITVCKCNALHRTQGNLLKKKARFETYLGDLAGVADTLVVVDSLIVVPKLDDLVIA